MSSCGFYKVFDGLIVFGGLFVVDDISDLDLNQENMVDLVFPVQGWYWFDTKNQAAAFFGLPHAM